MKRLLCLAGLLCCALAASAAEPLLTFTNVRLRDDAIDDGDSFWVQTESTSFVVRLYFVDCPETTAYSDTMARRVREQTRYFGLTEPGATMDFGRVATHTTHELLAEPFTVHTAFTPGGGASGVPRYYAFVTLADGRDLAGTLVEAGLARAHGTGRPAPDGLAQSDVWALLRDLEAYAMLRRNGIWQETDADHIVAERARQRAEDEELRRISAGGIIRKSGGLVNINQASKAELETVAGIGPVTAESIIAGRPYTNVDDLARVRGIGPKTLELLQASLTTEDAETKR